MPLWRATEVFPDSNNCQLGITHRHLIRVEARLKTWKTATYWRFRMVIRFAGNPGSRNGQLLIDTPVFSYERLLSASPRATLEQWAVGPATRSPAQSIRSQRCQVTSTSGARGGNAKNVSGHRMAKRQHWSDGSTVTYSPANTVFFSGTGLAP